MRLCNGYYLIYNDSSPAKCTLPVVPTIGRLPVTCCNSLYIDDQVYVHMQVIDILVCINYEDLWTASSTSFIKRVTLNNGIVPFNLKA